MGKGFAITSDLNLGEMLLAGYARHCTASSTDLYLESSPSNLQNDVPLPRIRIAAITNDTVATFIASAYAVKAASNSRVAMGLIVGTGTNATVPMRAKDLHPSKLDDLQQLEAVETIVINTEWTIRGTDAPLEALNIKTNWDRVLNQNSDAPGFQPFEYMTSGRYLGEIVRLAFIDSVASPIDTTKVPCTLKVKNALPTRFLSESVARLDDTSLQTLLAEAYTPYSFWTTERVQILRDLARAVQQRSSALIAAASIGLLACVGDIILTKPGTAQAGDEGVGSDRIVGAEELVIAYTGSTISQYPHWLDDCQKWIDELMAASGVNAGKRVVLREALDGGIVGAGVLAGMRAG
jgi:hexokinase